MANIRDGDVGVYTLKTEIRKRVEELKFERMSAQIRFMMYPARLQRLISDGEKFLAMLNDITFSNCSTVNDLKQRISKKRNSLKDKLVELDYDKDGHQISMFEVYIEISDEEKEARKKAIEDLNEEIHWLHKCLGICKNLDYFK